MKVAPGVEMLGLPAMLMNGPGSLYPTLLWDGRDAVLVDAGLPGMAPLFLEAITRVKVPLKNLTRIIITHHDLDHIGSLGDLQTSVPHRIEVLAHANEVPYIQGERIPVKMTPEMVAQMGKHMKNLPEEHRQGMRSMYEKLKEQKLKVDRTLADGEELPYCGGIRVLYTPGHTPGHICLYLEMSRTLIAGDALFVESGRLEAAPAFINADISKAFESLKILARYDIANVIAYHGGLFQDHPNARIAEILQVGPR
jgi:glyoxylase-like metal-dependent hydrolase (beta-lactamase superfamily II)